ncbi:uncharacterized protein [Spinacia oleracea]|uniref:Reverse transcriptase zinc-binding domain-containing protein n=1 Tax=Spinacia oleracea TaxID=3562 RepID=A0ABM3RJ77_SPIOL|nr:uncharacterized protein LOC130470104 [Spinacia oleracea]
MACRCFLWSESAGVTKRALVAWERLCLPKVQTPNQASWMVRKIIGASKFIMNIGPANLSVFYLAYFSTRKTYNLLRGNFEKVPWKKLICNNPCPPKCLFIGWLAVLRRLTTCDRLVKIGIQCDTLCCLCSKEQEDIEHLFFSCSWSSELWTKVLSWIGCIKQSESWSSEIDFVTAHATGNLAKHQIYRMVLFTSVYFVWRERNQRHFQGVTGDLNQVFREIQLVVYSTCFLYKKLRNVGQEL